MKSLRIREFAANDIQEAVNYYDENAPIVTPRFLNELKSALGDIAENPEKYAIKYKDIRVRFLKSFPIGIHYILIENTVHVLAVLHTSRNPEIWKSRR